MKRQGLLALALLAALFAFALACAVIGVDFGVHWDEPILIGGLSDAIRSGTWVQQKFNYPSLPYGLLMLQAFPDFLANTGDIAAQLSGNLKYAGPRPLPAVADAILQPDFLLRSRIMFAAITLGTAVWVFMIVRTLGRSVWEAVLAAAILLSSWELGYHARWVAPDGLLMQFGALTILLVLLAVKSKERGLMWLHASAAVVGLAISSKYPGGLLILPSAYAAWTILRRRNPDMKVMPLLARVAGVMATCGIAMMIAFFLTTPAALVSPLSVLGDAYAEVQHYKNGHYGNTVGPLFDHGGRLLRYLGLDAFSTFELIALPIFIAAIAGGVHLIRKDRVLGICLLLAPVVYLLYFSTQRVMFVRNVLILFPVFAILAARGFAWGLTLIRNRNLRLAGGAAIVIALAFNFSWLLSSALTIHPRADAELGAETANYLRAHSPERFYVSDSVRASLGANIPANVVSTPAEAQHVVLRSTDPKDYEFWTNANRPGTYTMTAGARDVNIDYYPPWIGKPHHVAVTPDQASQMGILPAP